MLEIDLPAVSHFNEAGWHQWRRHAHRGGIAKCQTDQTVNYEAVSRSWLLAEPGQPLLMGVSYPKGASMRGAGAFDARSL